MLPKIIKPTSTVLPIMSENVSNFEYRMNFDGCSKGNPGLCGAGAVIYYKNDEIWSESFFVGENATNNRAEYAGLILGLQQAIELKIKCLHVQGDSQLVINQMKGVYQCNSPNLLALYQRAKDLESIFEKIHYEHILRHLNKRADHLSNIALIKDHKP
jgi:ribonuclease HI